MHPDMMDPVRRDARAAAIVAAAQDRFPHREPSVEELRSGGLTICRPAMTAKQCQDCVAYFEGEPAYNSHVPVYSDGVARKVDRGYAYGHGSYKLAQVVRAPYLLETAVDPVHLHLAASYLGCWPTLYSMNVWWTFPGTGGIHDWHRDYDDYKFVSLFVYLTDVDEKTGPFVFQVGSHKGHISAPSSPMGVLGSAGTTVMVDSFGIHRGDAVKEGRRLAFWARYGISDKPWIYGNDRTEPVDRSLLAGRVPQTEHMARLLRIVVA